MMNRTAPEFRAFYENYLSFNKTIKIEQLTERELNFWKTTQRIYFCCGIQSTEELVIQKFYHLAINEDINSCHKIIDILKMFNYGNQKCETFNAYYWEKQIRNNQIPEHIVWAVAKYLDVIYMPCPHMKITYKGCGQIIMRHLEQKRRATSVQIKIFLPNLIILLILANINYFGAFKKRALRIVIRQKTDLPS